MLNKKNKMNNKLKKTLIGLLIAGASLIPTKSYSAELPQVNWGQVTLDKSKPSNPIELQFNTFEELQGYLNISSSTPSLGPEPRGIHIFVKRGVYDDNFNGSHQTIRLTNQWRIPYHLEGESNTESIIPKRILTQPNNFIGVENLNLIGYDGWGYGFGPSLLFSENSSGFMKRCNAYLIQIDTKADVSIDNNDFIINKTVEISDLKTGIFVTNYYPIGNETVNCSFYRNYFRGNGGGIAMKLQKGVDAGSVSDVTGYNVFDVEKAIYVMDSASPGIVEATNNCWIDSSSTSNNESEFPAKSLDRIVTDQTEIMDRFVVNNNPNVLVNLGIPLDYNPLTGEYPQNPIPTSTKNSLITLSLLLLGMGGYYLLKDKKR